MLMNEIQNWLTSKGWEWQETVTPEGNSMIGLTNPINAAQFPVGKYEMYFGFYSREESWNKVTLYLLKNNILKLK